MKENKYKPGYYDPNRPESPNLVDRFFEAWESQTLQSKPDASLFPPNICFSRKIGVGALEVADALGRELGAPVIDREIIEYISQTAELSERTVKMFDEKYPGTGSNFFNMLVGEKSFVLSDYSRQLSRAVLAMGGLGPVVFVGRGAHLILPRDRVLAVRLVASTDFRVNRVADIMDMDKKAVRKRMAEVDEEQHQYFKKVFGKNDAPLGEFDLVVVRDNFSDAQKIARLVKEAFLMKFGMA